MTATVSLSLDEYNAIDRKRHELQERVYELERQISNERLIDPSERVPKLVEGLIAAREIIRIAIAYAGPDIIPITWPADALEKFAEVWETLPGATPDNVDAAIDFRDLARTCRDVAQARARRS